MNRLLTLAGAALLAAVSLATAADKDDAKRPADRFKITTKRADDAVDVKTEKERTLFDVTSKFGISNAVIERKDERWPEVVVLRLRLRTLERLRLDSGKVSLLAAVAAQGGPTVRQRAGDKEGEALNEKSPYWMEIRMIGADGKPAKAPPLTNGYFEMTLPKAFFEGNPESITLDWVDAFRN
jgi:hypothetical protein